MPWRSKATASEGPMWAQSHHSEAPYGGKRGHTPRSIEGSGETELQGHHHQQGRDFSKKGINAAKEDDQEETKQAGRGDRPVQKKKSKKKQRRRSRTASTEAKSESEREERRDGERRV